MRMRENSSALEAFGAGKSREGTSQDRKKTAMLFDWMTKRKKKHQWKLIWCLMGQRFLWRSSGKYLSDRFFFVVQSLQKEEGERERKVSLRWKWIRSDYFCHLLFPENTQRQTSWWSCPREAEAEDAQRERERVENEEERDEDAEHQHH